MLHRYTVTWLHGWDAANRASKLNWAIIVYTIPDVGKVDEIVAALSQLNLEELLRVEFALHSEYQRRGGGIIYEDAYGTVTEANFILGANDAFVDYDDKEKMR